MRPPAIVVEYMGQGSLKGALARKADIVQGPLIRVLIAMDAAKVLLALCACSVVRCVCSCHQIGQTAAFFKTLSLVGRRAGGLAGPEAVVTFGGNKATCASSIRQSHVLGTAVHCCAAVLSQKITDHV